MDMPSLEKEAAHCRVIATEFAGRPEEPFLLQLASAMEELAHIRGRVEGIAGDLPHLRQTGRGKSGSARARSN